MKPSDKKSAKVAIVHDWLIEGGAERVTHELHKMFPEAPIYTSYCTDNWRKKLDNKVITGTLQHWPFSALRKFLAIPRIWWFGRLDLSAYDLVISVSGNGEAFGIKTSDHTVHVNYCHTPTHYYWRHYDLYIKSPGFGILNPLARLGLKMLISPLRRWDYRAAQRPNYFIANSTHIQDDIKKYYGRESTVINPPVDVDRFSIKEPQKRSGFVIAARQVPHKKVDLAIQACNQLGVPLKVLGKGPEHQKLVDMAGPTISFVEQVSDAEMPDLIASGQAFIFPSFEDFGVFPIESLATGTPVIAYRDGGALDYIKEGENGLFFDQQTVSSLVDVLKKFDSSKFDHDKVRESAQYFSTDQFKKNILNFLAEIESQ